MSGATYGLLVAIDEYRQPVPRLRGCVADVEAVAELLAARASRPEQLRLVTLRNAQATRDAVISTFRDHLGQATGQDSVLFYYSGHGAQAVAPPELWAVEPDHQLETLVLYDSRQPGGWDLADKELAVLIAHVAASGAHVLVVLDCCHSGTGTRDVLAEGLRPRLAQPDDRVRPIETFVLSTPVVTRGVAADPAAPGVAAAHVLLAACRAGELAKEVSDAGMPHGAFSAGLQQALREAGGVVTYRDVHRWAAAAVRNRVEAQSPQLEVTSAGDLDRPFLGGALRECPPYYTLTRDDTLGWVIDGGAVHGIPASSGEETTELAVLPLTADAAGQLSDALATGRVVDVLADRSTVVLNAELDTARAYRAVVTAIPLPPLAVRLVGTDVQCAPLREALAAAEATLVAQVTGEGEGDLVVTVSDTGASIVRPGASVDRAVVTAGPEWVGSTVAVVQHIARWLRLARLRNPATAMPAGAVRVSLVAADGARSDTSLTVAYAVTGGVERQPGFTVSLANTTDRRLWCALVDLTETYGVFTDAFAEGAVELGPGEEASVSLVGEVADSLLAKGIRSVTDQLKVIVSTAEFDPRTLQQDELDVTAASVTTRSVPTVPSAPTSTLERLVQRVTTRRVGPRPAAAERLTDWLVVDTFVTVARGVR